MFRKKTVIFMAMVLAACCLTACSGSSSNSGSPSEGTAASQTNSAASDSSNDDSSSEASTVASDRFADSDYKDVTGEKADAEITLSGSNGTISDTTRGSSGSEVTITSKGVYHITGSSENVSVTINDSTESGNIYLILDNVNMTNTSAACINVEACDKLIIQCVGENTLTLNSSDSSLKTNGAVYSKDDVTINGSGSLNIVSGLHGIVCKDDLKITDSKLSVQADSIGIKGGTSVRIGGGTISVNSGHDGIQLADDDNTGTFYFEKAILQITAGYDGISVKAGDETKTFEGSVTLNGGTMKIVTAGGNGSSVSKDSNTSQKGIKTDGVVTISDTTLDISSADDAIHGNSAININSGTLNLSSSDDGITASNTLTINGGTVNVTQSYEGLEGSDIIINSGDISVISSDDGLNTSGGSDSSQQNDDAWNNTTANANLTINGGNVYVNANGDGLDSNGSIYITGGTVIVEGPSGSGNGALDKGDGAGCVASVTGGTVLAIGSTDMAVNFDSGTQCAALVTLSGSSGTEIRVNDGTDFSFTATKDFGCVVYSSPGLSQGSTYTITAGSNTATMDFSSGLTYSDVTGREAPGTRR